jgi:hypothetical protein
MKSLLKLILKKSALLGGMVIPSYYAKTSRMSINRCEFGEFKLLRYITQYFPFFSLTLIVLDVRDLGYLIWNKVG